MYKKTMIKKNFVCKICDCRFESSLKLYVHSKAKHGYNGTRCQLSDREPVEDGASPLYPGPAGGSPRPLGRLAATDGPGDGAADLSADGRRTSQPAISRPAAHRQLQPAASPGAGQVARVTSNISTGNNSVMHCTGNW